MSVNTMDRTQAVVMTAREFWDLDEFIRRTSLPPLAIVTNGGYAYGYRTLTQDQRRNIRQYFELGDRVTIALEWDDDPDD